MSSAARSGLIACEECGRVWPRDQAEGHRCARCGAALHRRRPNSLARTTALLVAAAILLLPANILPILRTTMTGRVKEDTILSGIQHFFAQGQVAVALLVLVASFVVPGIKIIGLSWMLLSVRFRWDWRLRDRTALYRLIEFVGRWSMVDVFMISILAGLVRLSALATIEVGPGAPWFAAVVVLTMLATRSFDPRLMWDVREAKS
jgi:paraquat-inducible protein A